MKRYLSTIIVITSLFMVASCGSKSVYTKGKYINPEEVKLLSDKFGKPTFR